MSACELCGKEENLLSAFVEGVIFRVCSNCSRYGKVIEEKRFVKIEKREIRREEVVEVILGGFNLVVKNAREKKRLSQEELATKLNEKESLISKIEQGSLKPSIDLAKKLERFLGVKLITQEKIEEAPTKVKTAALTIGDFIKKSS